MVCWWQFRNHPLRCIPIRPDWKGLAYRSLHPGRLVKKQLNTFTVPKVISARIETVFARPQVQREGVGATGWPIRRPARSPCCRAMYPPRSTSLELHHNRVTLDANFRGGTVSNEFTITENYRRQGYGWKMTTCTRSSARDTHGLELSGHLAGSCTLSILCA